MSYRAKVWKSLAAAAALSLALSPAAAAQPEILLQGSVDIERDLPNVTIEDTSSGSLFLIAARPTASFFGTFTNSNFGIRVNNTDLIRLTTALRVGIGTASPISKLHVVGDVRVENGSFIDDGIPLNVPDYVFEEGYALMPLNELGDYVAREKHLPNVPTAEEIAENGLNLGAFQMHLLEKVEELTLYLVEQNDQLRDQEDRNRNLEEDLAALQAENSELLGELLRLQSTVAEFEKRLDQTAR